VRSDGQGGDGENLEGGHSWWRVLLQLEGFGGARWAAARCDSIFRRAARRV
jgi:hypothetical protein